jgi:asparagine synthase (glutamine-hydrolysing)
MCGISGIIHLNHQPVPEQALQSMMRAMKHRGPNDSGLTSPKTAMGLGFVRLSILDLSAAGHQPMFFAR